MILSDKKVVVQRVKGGSFRFITVQDFNIVRIDAVGTLIIPPHHYVLPKDFNIGATILTYCISFNRVLLNFQSPGPRGGLLGQDSEM